MDTSNDASSGIRGQASFPLIWTDGAVTDSSGTHVSAHWSVRQRIRSLDVTSPTGRTWRFAPLGLTTNRLLCDVDSDHPLHLIRMTRGFGPAQACREIRTDDGDLVATTKSVRAPRGKGPALKMELGQESREEIVIDETRFADLTAVLLALGRIDAMSQVRK